MTNPFLLPLPSVISFSGGRTSAYMLRRIIDAFGGKLPSDVVPIFCNTGKERTETLDFVERCSEQWDTEVVWLEFSACSPNKFIRVDYATASRNGEPFSELIRVKQMLPNVVMRFCTQWLKIKVSNRYARHVLGWKTGYHNAIGLRADEPRRVAKQRADPKLSPGEEPCAPLAKAKVVLADVMRFWSEQSFDLQLRPDEGNCDLCFLKGRGKLLNLIRESPEMAQWWIDHEAAVVGKTKSAGTARFRRSSSYAGLLKLANEQPELFDDEPDFPDCRCTD